MSAAEQAGPAGPDGPRASVAPGPGSRRVLHVLHTLGRGGAEVALLGTAAALRQRGVTVAVASLSLPDDLVADLRAAGAEVHVLGRRPGHPSPLAALRLARLVRRWRPDVVHAHLFWPVLFSALAVPATGRRRGRRPARVATLHGVDYALWPATTPLHRLRRRVHLHLLRRSYDALLAVGDDVRDHYAAQLGPRARPILVTPNGVDVAVFRARAAAARADAVAVRARYGVPLDAFLVLTVGRLSGEKDQRTLVAALGRLTRAAGGDGGRPVHLVLAGSGPLDAVLAEAAVAEGVAPSVHLAGQVSSDEVAALLGAADVFALPSRHEGQGLALVEAMACGVACVGSDTSGIRELLQDGVTGRLHPVGDVTALAAILEEMRADPGERARLGAAAAAAAGAYDLATVAERLADVYGDVLATVRP